MNCELPNPFHTSHMAPPRNTDLFDHMGPVVNKPKFGGRATELVALVKLKRLYEL